MIKTRSQRIKRMNVVDAIDVRSQVSVKSTRYCKKLSKYLAELQLAESKKNPSFILCPTMGPAMKLYLMDARSFRRSLLNTIDPSQKSHEESMYMVSSYNGLICCVNEICDEDVQNKFCDLQIWICNPCTRETLLLPQGRPSFGFVPSVGVAYGSDISDYRIFRIFCIRKKIPIEKVTVKGYYYQEGEVVYTLAYECEVYSSSNGSWKNIGPVPCFPMRSAVRPFRSGHIFVGGKIYWLASLDEPGEILSVDLEGKFEVINLPEYPDGIHGEETITDATYLMNLQGSLSLFVLHPSYMDIWVWKHDGEKYSWDPLLTEKTPIKDEELVITVSSLKNKIICLTDTQWRVYDMGTKKWKKIRSPSTGFRNPAVFPFTESIRPCNGGVGQ
ncbi:hypothetical protein CARUB_v10013919mg [Capsella rubella]|uniref:F-box associated beta-propeller type 3 domain-containing protein n=1 Tax=Capsella rubella TaxID=81985 RepID=R0HYU8_9BRAS|nr:F-box protein At5g07610 [Capsella rubella]EOA30775.1 hypothetical protein CARUB_v10013919mg [Capsella rubella]